MRIAPWAVLAAAAVLCPLVACSSDPSGGDDPTVPGDPTNDDERDPSPPGPRGDGGTTTPSDPSACPRAPKAADRARAVVVSHPYGADGAGANVFEVLALTQAGELGRTGQTFTMGRSSEQIVFTPDGEVGIAAHQDGTLGVFRVDEGGAVTVVHEKFEGSFHASRVVMARDGARAFVLDSNTADNGGGVYGVRIGCDGTLADEGVIVPGGKAHAMALVPSDPDKAVLIGGAAFDSPAGDYAHLVDFSGASPARVKSGTVFPDEDAIASAVAVTFDGKWALVTDHGLFGGDRMAPVELSTMTAGSIIGVSNPVNVVMSPFGNAGLLIESEGTDHLRRLTYDPASSTAPFAVAGEIAYAGGKTTLPLVAATIDVGSLKGRVLVAELDGVRQLAFDAAGAITDVGKLTFGDGFTEIVGALGVQP